MTIKRFSIFLAALIGLLAVAVVAINLWIPKQLLVNYISTETGARTTVENITVGWDWGPDIRIDGLVLEGVNLGDSSADLDITTTRLKISFEALWKSIIGAGDSGQDAARDEGEDPAGNGGADWLAQYFQSLKIVNGTAFLAGEPNPLHVEADLLEIRALDAVSTGVLFEGRLDGMETVLSGTISGVGTLVSENWSQVELYGHVLGEENTIHAEGSVHDVRNFSKIFLDVTMEFGNPSRMAAHYGRPDLDLGMFAGARSQFELAMPGQLDTLDILALDIRGGSHGIDFRVSGDVGRERILEDVDLQLEVVGETVAPSVLGISGIGGSVAVDMRGRITGSLDELIFAPSEALLEADGVSARIDGEIVDVLGDWKTPARLEMRIAPQAPFVDPEAAFLFPATLRAELVMQGGGLSARKIRFVSREDIADHARVVASGELAGIGSAMTGSFSIEGLFDRQGLEHAGYAGLAEGIVVEAATTLHVDNAELALDDIALTGRLPGMSLEGVGTYSLSGEPGAVTIRMKGEADSLKSVGKALGEDWPATNRITASAMAKRTGDLEWVLEDIRVQLAEEDVTIDANGEVRLHGKGKMGEIVVTALAHQPRFMSRLTDSDLLRSLVEPVMPLEGTGVLHLERKSEGRVSYSLRDMNIRSRVKEGLAMASGQIVDLESPDWSGVIGITVRDNQGRFSGLLSPDRVEQHPILSETMEADVRLAFDGDGPRVEDLSVLFSAEDARVEARGSVETLDPFLTRDMKIDFKVEALSRLDRLSGLNRFQNVPAEGSVRVTNNPQGHVDVDIGAKIDGRSINGDWRIDFSPSGKQNISGSLFVDEFDLERILVRTKNRDRMFTDRPFDLGWLDSINLDLELDVGHYRNRLLVLDHVSGNLELHEGVLRIDSVGHSHGVPLDMWFELRPAGTRWATRLGVFGENVDIDALDYSMGHAADLNSVFSIDVELAAEGRSMSEMATGAPGHVNLEVRDVQIEKDEGFVHGDLVLGVVDLILPLKSRKKFDLVECGVARLDIGNGVASMDNSLAMKFRDHTILGSGQIDLASENLDIVFSSKARKGLGISPNTIVKILKVGGTLREPELVGDPGGFLSTGVSLAAAIVTGGLSLLAQGLLDKEVANSDVCQIARSGAPVTEAGGVSEG